MEQIIIGKQILLLAKLMFYLFVVHWTKINREAIHIMDKAFQHEYAKAIALFNQKISSELNITYAEIDQYFRECVLYLMSYSQQMRNNPDPEIINQLYTETPVKFSPEQIVHKIDESKLDRKRTEAAVPGFFQRMLAADAAAGTCISREFIQLQQEILMLYASSEAAFSFEESRQLIYLGDRLTAICNQEGVAQITTPGREGANMSQAAIEGLNSQLTKAAKSTCRKKNVKIGRGTTAESTLERAYQIVQEVDRMAGTVPSAEETGNPQNDSALYLADAMRGIGQADGSLQVSVADYAMEALKNKSKKNTYHDREKSADKERRPTLEEALEKLNRMIGLESVKNQVQSLVDYIKISKLREKHGSKSRAMSYHLVFTGNPGTGKTTVARIIADIYAALGILRKGHLVPVAREDLVGEYLGKTEKKTKKFIKKALGGVLFIDEAYMLTEKANDPDQYGRAAVGAILKAMEDYRDDLVVIVAGYDNLMKDFIESNPGLKSRFATKIFFEDYNAEQLYKIFLSMLEEDNYRLDIQASVLAAVYFKHMYQNRGKEFGNGRDVRNSYERLCRLQATRLSQMGTEPTKEELDTFTAEDMIALTNTIEVIEGQPKKDAEKREDADETGYEEVY